MSGTEVNWGGVLGELLDVPSGTPVFARCFGQGVLEITDVAAFAASVESAGGDSVLVDWVRQNALQAVRTDVGERSQAGAGLLAIADDNQALVQGTEAAVNALLEPMGASLRVTNVQIVLDEDVRAQLVEAGGRSI